MVTVREYRVNLGWSYRKTAQQAGVAPSAVKNAEEGKPITPASAKAIADAFSRALGREIKPLEIEGLNIL
jgi:transcriptional regulator with XRE-family HTH domain